MQLFEIINSNLNKPLTTKTTSSKTFPFETLSSSIDFNSEDFRFDMNVLSILCKNFSSLNLAFDAILDLLDLSYFIKERFRKEAIYIKDVEIIPNQMHGVSNSYYIVDENGNKKFIVKPLDEDVGCIQNFTWPTTSLSNPIRENIDLYQSSMREALAYRIAVQARIGSIIPETHLSIIKSDAFHYLFDHLENPKYKEFKEACQKYEKEKICSVQEYVPNAISLFSALQDFLSSSLSDEEIEKRFDQTDFEEANLLIWLTNDTDAHSGNFLVYPKGVDDVGNEILGIKKIDNGLAFPEKNEHLRNHLSYLPNADRVLSDNLREKIQSLNENIMVDEFISLGLECSVSAFKERVQKLKELAKNPKLTIKEINTIMASLNKNEEIYL